MVPIEQETNLEVIKSYAVWLKTEVEKLSRENAELKGAQDAARQTWLDSQLRDQLTRLQKKFYGFGRETLSKDRARCVGHEQQRLKLHGKRWHEEDVVAPTVPVQESENDERVEHDFDRAELERESDLRGIPMSAKAWEKINGLYQEATEITVVERVYKKVIHRQAKYRLKEQYNTTGKEVIITAPGQVKIKAGCQYSVDFALAVVSDKYEYHLPLERIRRKMESAGFEIEVKTLYSLCASVAQHCEGEVLASIRRDILNDFCAAHLDECPWLILGSKSKSYMWVLSNRVGSYYQFEPTRSGLISKELLGDYQGAVVTDGFAGYNRIKSIEGIRAGHCWSHVRREFFERFDAYPKEVSEIVAMIDELFEIESKAESFEELRSLRKTESKDTIARINRWLWETRSRFLLSEGLISAVNYSLKFWKELTLFLSDLSVPLSNNDAERALRHVVMGRKNFAGSKSIDGADVAATLYTVIESAKRVGLDPKDYLKYVITEHWHKRQPKSPAQLSAEKFGKNKKTIFPDKTDWRV